MKGGDLSNKVNHYIVFDSELIYHKKVPKWREVMKMGKTEYNHTFIRYLHNLYERQPHLSIGMFCFPSEHSEIERVLEEHGVPVTRVFVIREYEELSDLPVIVERIISNEPSVLNRTRLALDYSLCRGIY